MNASPTPVLIRHAILALLLVAALSTARAQSPTPFAVQLSDTTSEYQRVFGGPPQTTTMHSGLVVLAPAKTAGKHSTKSYEEALVVFSGAGEFRVEGSKVLPLVPHAVIYCPPNTEHDVVNTGTTPLRYLYIAAKVK